MAAPAVVSGSGYSGTPLPKKLGYADGQAVLFVALPQELSRLSESADFGSVGTVDGTDRLGREDGHYDLIHAFFTEAAVLADAAPRLKAAIRPDGVIWVSWPKKASKRPTDITEDLIRRIVLPLGLVDVKVAAVDEIWSGLKLVIRKALR